MVQAHHLRRAGWIGRRCWSAGAGTVRACLGQPAGWGAGARAWLTRRVQLGIAKALHHCARPLAGVARPGRPSCVASSMGCWVARMPVWLAQPAAEHGSSQGQGNAADGGVPGNAEGQHGGCVGASGRHWGDLGVAVGTIQTRGVVRDAPQELPRVANSSALKPQVVGLQRAWDGWNAPARRLPASVRGRC